MSRISRISGTLCTITGRSVSSAAASGSLTQTGVPIGTPAYIAPEQATADPQIDHRADIYAFGVLAYELFAGRLPFIGATAQEDAVYAWPAGIAGTTCAS